MNAPLSEKIVAVAVVIVSLNGECIKQSLVTSYSLFL